ncbi:hypothetical protein A1359_00255 [Methylomonas lenta]|uniref:Uncharacterized protein n=1 Tax=Methylomonas lenta TaxID=980561 RepID=A0A177NGK4_9GAMM|nr:hypothetical protein A1359_00255 [Methylomonas lenta]
MPTRFLIKHAFHALHAFSTNTTRAGALHQLSTGASSLVNGLIHLAISHRFANTNVHDGLD